MKEFDAIVIGSGIGGLVGASILTARGLRTLMIERHATAGGYVSSFARKGFVFDSAVDCISGGGTEGLFRKTLDLLGAGERVRFLRVDPIRVSRFPDADIAVDAAPGAYMERLTRLFPSESAAINSFFDRAGRVYDEMQRSLHALINGEPGLNAISSDTLRLMDASYGELLSEYFRDHRLKAALSDRCPFIGLPPSGVSAVAMINMIMSYFHLGAFRPEGGFQRLADAFVEGIKAKGGEVLLGSEVAQIIMGGDGLCKGVRCVGGEEFSARHIVSNADFALTFRRLVGGRHAQIADDMLRSPGISSSFFVVYAGVEGRVDLHSSMGYFPSYDMERFFDADMELSEDSTIGVTVASREDASRAPQGCHTVVLHEMIGSTGRKFDKGECVARIIRKAEQFLPGLEGRIVAADAATPATMERYTLNHGGAAFGWRQRPGFRGTKRHGIRNLHIAGHWGDLGGGVLAAGYSGAKAAGAVLAAEGIRDVI